MIWRDRAAMIGATRIVCAMIMAPGVYSSRSQPKGPAFESEM